MTAVCPGGHVSATTDYCDRCGAPIATAAAPPTGEADDVADVDTSSAARQRPCPVCGAHRSGDDRFCEGCGHDFAAPPPAQVAAAADWEAVAGADRGQFARHASAGVEYPDGYSERCFELGQAQVRIGRSGARPGVPALEIDLAGRPQDPGISHMHAVLERQPDGSYAVRDLGSTNGTSVNDDPTPIEADTAVALDDGDRIRIGAWTTITVRRRAY